MLTLILASIALAAAAPAAAPNPLAPAAQGKVECYTPDTAKKTCKSLAAYRPKADGGYDNMALAMLQANPLITMQILSPVRVKNGQVCGPVRDQDIDGARFAINGGAATLEQSAQLREQVRTRMARLKGGEVCTLYLPAPNGMRIARAIENGKPRPELDQKVIWVTEADGYRVAP
jgi:hypothetical protein